MPLISPILQDEATSRQLPLSWTALAMFAVLALAGAVVGWGRGQLPHRDPVVAAESSPVTSVDATAPDLQLYREVVAEVRTGRNYYDVARERIPKFGFPIRSPLNWRLPTYAWIFLFAPSPAWIQAAIVLLSLAALTMAFVAEKRRSGPIGAIVVVLLLVGVVRWSLDGEAFYAQEIWAATLILISVSAYALGWRGTAIVAGLAALMFRELALPYCAAAAVLALYHRRWFDAGAWTAGIALFFAFLTWHVLQVHAQLQGLGEAGGTDLMQWLRLGGLDFVLLTTRMNGLLFAAPAVLLWLYLLASLIGLSTRTDEASQIACFAALLYVLAFAIVGRPENFYWGLMVAPLFPWGISALCRPMLTAARAIPAPELAISQPSAAT
jgi:hypothetical protein